MPRIVRGALVQASWTGDKESMIQKHEERAHEAAKQGAQVILLPGAVLRPLLLPGPGRPVLQLHRAHPRRPDDEADAGPRQADRHGPRRADVRGGREGLGHLLQHRRGHRRRRDVPRQVPQDPHPARQGLLGEVLLPARATSATRCSRPRSARSACTSATTATSPRAPGRSASTAPRSCFIPSATSRGLSEYLWRIEQVSHAVANGYFVGTINRVGIETDLGDDDFYGQSYFVDPRGQFVGDVGSRPRRGADRPRPRPRHDHRGPPDLAVLPRPAAGRVRTTSTRTRDDRAVPSRAARPSGGGQPSRFRLRRRRTATCSSGSRSSPTTPSSARSP